LDREGKLFILEVNSLPGLGENSSYAAGGRQVGIDYVTLINRLVEVASARYFGTPEPPKVDRGAQDPASHAFTYVTQRKDRLEHRLERWTAVSSRTGDSTGLQHAVEELDATLRHLGMKPVKEFTEKPTAWTWETKRGFEGGALFVGHLDVPIDTHLPPQRFRRGPEWLSGEGIGSSRAGLVMLEYALRSLYSMHRLRQQPIGVLYYTDEGLEARHSEHIIRAAAAKAKRVLVLTPGHGEGFVVTHRRGQRKYGFRVEGDPLGHGRLTRKADVLRWAWGKLERFSQLTAPKNRVSVSTIDLQTERLPLRLPHRITATILLTYPNAKVANGTEERMRDILGDKGPRWDLELISDRPPMLERRRNLQLVNSLAKVAEAWDIPLKHESSSWPSVAGLVPAKTACVGGIAPIARDVCTPNEAVQRASLVQRTLLLAQFLAEEIGR
jgi:D-alanine-D-alanine ligase